MSQDQEPHTEPDEISLVDLLSVLVRYRRMIVFGTLLVAVVALVVLFVLPAAGVLEAYTPLYAVGLEVRVAPVPDVAAQYSSVDLLRTLNVALVDPAYVLPYYEQMQASREDYQAPDRTRPEQLRYLQEEYIGDEYTVSVDSAQSVVTLRCRCEDPERGEVFLRSLASNLPSAVQEELALQIAPTTMVLEQSLSVTLNSLASAVLAGSQDLLANELPRSSGPVLADLVRYLERTVPNSLATLSELVLAQQYFSELSTALSSFLSVADEVEVIAAPAEGAGRATRLVLTVIAAIFALTLTAFVRQYARNVSQDPSQIEKLQEAWAEPRRR